jgi:hypothetical protein
MGWLGKEEALMLPLDMTISRPDEMRRKENGMKKSGKERWCFLTAMILLLFPSSPSLLGRPKPWNEQSIPQP